jgi:hypothetical protein
MSFGMTDTIARQDGYVTDCITEEEGLDIAPLAKPKHHIRETMKYWDIVMKNDTHAKLMVDLDTVGALSRVSKCWST